MIDLRKELKELLEGALDCHGCLQNKANEEQIKEIEEWLKE